MTSDGSNLPSLFAEPGDFENRLPLTPAEVDEVTARFERAKPMSARVSRLIYEHMQRGLHHGS